MQVWTKCKAQGCVDIMYSVNQMTWGRNYRIRLGIKKCTRRKKSACVKQLRNEQKSLNFLVNGKSS